MKIMGLVSLLFFLGACMSKPTSSETVLLTLKAELSEEKAGSQMGKSYYQYQFVLQKNTPENLIFERIWLSRGGSKGVWEKISLKEENNRFMFSCSDEYSSRDRLENTEPCPLEGTDNQAVLQYKIKEKIYFFPIQKIKVISRKLSR